VKRSGGIEQGLPLHPFYRHVTRSWCFKGTDSDAELPKLYNSTIGRRDRKMGKSEARDLSLPSLLLFSAEFTHQFSSEFPSKCLPDVTMLVFVVNPSTAGMSN
jgi:hypothetical protein